MEEVQVLSQDCNSWNRSTEQQNMKHKKWQTQEVYEKQG